MNANWLVIPPSNFFPSIHYSNTFEMVKINIINNRFNGNLTLKILSEQRYCNLKFKSLLYQTHSDRNF